MPAKKYHVVLSVSDRDRLTRLSVSQRQSARERLRARILLLVDEGQEGGPLKDAAAADRLGCDELTISRVRRRYAQGDLDAALRHKPQARRKARALDGAAEAHLIALVCGAPPEGHKRWSLHLLKDKLIELRVTDTVSHETVRQTLKKMNLNLG